MCRTVLGINFKPVYVSKYIHLVIVALVCDMKLCGGLEVYFPSFLTEALGGGEWSASRPRPLYPHGKDSALAIESEA